MRSFALDRRTLLRGAGAAIALPLLDAMAPRRAALAAPPPVRLLVYFYPNGTRISKFFPSTPGALTAPSLSPYTKVFAPVAGQPDILPYLNIVSGLRHDNVLEGGHDRACAAVGVSDGQSHDNSGALPTGPSLDQALAEVYGNATRFPSIVMGLGGHSKLQDAFVSWKSGGRPVQPVTDPKSLFAKVFGAGAGQESADRLTRAAARRQSVLDSIREQATGLEARLGAADRARVAEHLTAIRELEKQIAPPGPAAATCAAPDPATLNQHPVALMCKLVTLAFKCDQTRYASIHIDRGGQASYPGSAGGDHDLSHNAPDDVIELRTNLKLKFMADMMRQMATMDDGGRPLLENTIIVNTSEVADGRGHGHNDLPVVVGGRAGGKLQGGRYLAHKGKLLNDLFTSVVNYAGLDAPRWGTGATGPLPGF